MRIFENTKAVAQFGFATILLLIMGLGGFIVFEFDKLNRNITEIVEISNKKSELAFTMRDAIRLRSISLRNMLAMSDVFDRDNEVQRFHTYATLYAVSREKLLKLPKTDVEMDIHSRLDEAIQIARPLNLLASEFLIDEAFDSQKGQLIVSDAFEAQHVALNVLDELVEKQKQFTENTLKRVDDSYHSTTELVLLVGIFAAAITFFIMFSVGKFITNKNLALRQATEAKSRFLANMSHEIRTPLTAIIGFSRLLQSNRVDKEKTAETLSTVIKNAEHLMHLINDVLDVSKIEANRLEIERAEFSLFEFMADIKNMMEGVAQKKGLDFDVQFQYPLPESIFSDEVRLKQILVNLCSNATKFTDHGHVKIYVSYDLEVNQLSFEVRDTGIGLNPEQQVKIFKAFSQADVSTTKKYGGTGLGLTISSQLCLKMGGELKVESEEGKGSKFYFKIYPGQKNQLTLVESMPELNCKSPDVMSSLDEVRVSGKILLVDDTIDNQVLISAYLQQVGADVIVANNGQEAVELTQKNVFDLIFMDMQMPVMNGLDAIKLIRSQGYNHPITMLTANVFKDEKERCIEAGCDDFLVKPIDIPELCRVVSRFLPARKFQPVEKNVSGMPLLTEEESENVVISTLMGKSEKYDKLVERFASQLPEFIQNVRDAFKKNDYEKLHYHVHRLKGVGGNYGYYDITSICEQIEILARDRDAGSIAQEIKNLEQLVLMINKGFEVYHEEQSEGKASKAG